MPNGEVKLMQKDVESLKQDMSDLKYTLLNPEDGVIVKTNQNSSFRRRLEGNEKDFSDKMLQVKELKKWRDGVNKALWIIFATLFGVVIKLVSEVIKLG
mgnify:FL=1